jgi:hypothetical protein
MPLRSLTDKFFKTTTMARHITCINKDSGYHENPYVAITNLGGNDDGYYAFQKWSRENMYDFVKAGGIAYVKDAGGNRANLIAEISARGNKYVKTKADDVTSDNLLKLKEC